MIKHNYKNFTLSRLVFAGGPEGPTPEPEAPQGNDALAEHYSDPSLREGLYQEAEDQLSRLPEDHPEKTALETRLTNARIAEQVGRSEAQQAAAQLDMALGQTAEQYTNLPEMVNQGEVPAGVQVNGERVASADRITSSSAEEAEQVVAEAEAAEGNDRPLAEGLKDLEENTPDVSGPEVEDTDVPDFSDGRKTVRTNPNAS
jgi:hypothetical protein